MPYIGTRAATNFASTIRDNFTGDGSTTDFTLILCYPKSLANDLVNPTTPDIAAV